MPLQLSGTSGVLDNSGAFIAGTAVASSGGGGGAPGNTTNAGGNGGVGFAGQIILYIK